MNDLLKLAIEAHGGLGRWDAFSRLRAELNVDEDHQRGFGPFGLLKDITFSPDGKTLAITVGNDIWWVDLGFFDQQISDLARAR